MEQPSIRNKVLILGKSSRAKHFVVRELFHLSNQKLPKELQQESGTCLTEEALSLPFRIDNKYYTADIDLWVDVAPDALGTEVVAAYKPVAHLIDAVIFVYTKDDSDSFSDIFPWATFVETWEPAIVLCVQAKSENNDSTNFPADPLEWCVENGFEFVDLTTEDQETGDIARIYEALESNLWQGLERKETKPNSIPSQSTIEELLPEHERALPSCNEIEFMRKKLFSTGDADPFSEIQRLREHAQTLSDSERRILAAQVALSFGEEMDSIDSEGDQDRSN